MNLKPEIKVREKNILIHTTEHDIQFHKNLQSNNRRLTENLYSTESNIKTPKEEEKIKIKNLKYI